jgi:RNA:NAD 2'-phosphotransferase (TPT1/KptA family)
MKLLTPVRCITSRPFILPRMSRPYNKVNNSGRGGARNGRRNDSPTVALSKQLSWLLRHHLDNSGLQVRTDGYVRLDELVPLILLPIY